MTHFKVGLRPCFLALLALMGFGMGMGASASPRQACLYFILTSDGNFPLRDVQFTDLHISQSGLPTVEKATNPQAGIHSILSQ